MSFDNPTRLRLGMQGHVDGKDYRLAGRVVLGVTDDGETYYWNEFNLEATDGTTATLVYEVTERGGEWRLFTLFEPEYPMTAEDAATKRVGDPLNLTGTDVRVTLLDTSRVYHIEGQAPEGVAVGSVAKYFNAEAGDIMQVVSWTGDQVEYYNGVTLPSRVVDAAFQLPSEPGGMFGLGKRGSAGSGSGSSAYSSGLKFTLQAAGVLLLFWLIFGRNLSCSTDYEAAPVKRIAAGQPPLALGATGEWNGKHYRIAGHTVVTLARVGLTFDRHEYELADDYGINCLLICGDKPDAGDWLLLEQFFPLLTPPPSAQKLAAKQVGETVELDGYTGQVNDLYRTTVLQADGDGMASLKAGTVAYGLAGTNAFTTLHVRWNNEGVRFYRGQAVAAKKIAADFAGTK